MKNSRFFKSIYHITIAGILVPATALYSQKPIPRHALESARRITAPSKERIISRLDREIKIVKAGIQATQKKLRGQSLTASEAKAASLLAKHAGILAALIGAAVGIGTATYLGLKRKGKRPEAELPLTSEEIIVQHWQKGKLSPREQELIKSIDASQPKVWPTGPFPEETAEEITSTKPLEPQTATMQTKTIQTERETLEETLQRRRGAISPEDAGEEEEEEEPDWD